MSEERSHKFQKSSAEALPDSAEREPVPPRAQDCRPSRRSAARPERTLEIPSQTRPDPSDLPEHIDRRSPCSMLKEEKARPPIPHKAGSHPHRPQVTVIIPEAKQPDPSDDPEHRDECVSSPGLLLAGGEDCE